MAYFKLPRAGPKPVQYRDASNWPPHRRLSPGAQAGQAQGGRWGSASGDAFGAATGFMFRIAISPEAFAAVAATLPLGTVGYEPQRDRNGDRFVWLYEADREQARRAVARGLTHAF